MGSSFHYSIDLNEDQIDQPFFSPLGSSLHHNHHRYHDDDDHLTPWNLSSSSSSLTAPSLSHLPFLINSHQDQVHVGYNNNTFHGFLDPYLSQSLETKKFVSNDGGSPSSDQMVPKKETRLKLTILKKDRHHDHEQVKLMKRKTMIKKTSANQYNIIVNETGYNGSNNCVIRICSDCNTTKTPLWRSGPRGPKSLCNACGIRQRKARQAAMAAAGATTNSEYLSPPLLKKKMQSKNKRSNEVSNLYSSLAPKVKKCKSTNTSMEPVRSGYLENQGKSTMSSSSTSSSSNKFYSDDLAMMLRKSSAYQQVFPQDEKEAAILLMALSYGMVHG
ncbi:putative GATA transcription factor 22 [Raphanus sativus]|uniref:GATA transcription factor 22 n=1 Tax=Raphanus sativus TaxID=3726 RepID=A0A6J0M7P5_RAPSA|nr:putative GATA transcription factor 22 [Raphanus sativus]KAJ4913218.1 putative GATA transcription factor 22 [Raphanus sativus]